MDIPIEVAVAEQYGAVTRRLTDLGHGGLCFDAAAPIAPGTVVRLRISSIRPAFEATARVAWCRPRGDHHVVGVSFAEDTDLFRVRMVEQVCHIELYRRHVLELEGRALSSQAAALEWISKYAHEFPGSADAA